MNGKRERKTGRGLLFSWKGANTKADGLMVCAMDMGPVHSLTDIDTRVNGRILRLPVDGITGRREIKPGLIWTKIGSGYTKTLNQSELIIELYIDNMFI